MNGSLQGAGAHGDHAESTMPTEQSPEFKRSLKRTVDGLLKEAQANGRYTDYKLDTSAARTNGVPAPSFGRPSNSSQNGALVGAGIHKGFKRSEGRTSFIELLQAARRFVDFDEELGEENDQHLVRSGQNPRTSRKVGSEDPFHSIDPPITPAKAHYRAPSVHSVNDDQDGAGLSGLDSLPPVFHSSLSHVEAYRDSQPLDAEIQELASRTRSTWTPQEQTDDSEADVNDPRASSFRTSHRTATGQAHTGPESVLLASTEDIPRASPGLIVRTAKHGVRRQRKVMRSLFKLGSPVRQRHQSQRQQSQLSHQIWTGPPAEVNIVEIVEDESEPPAQRNAQLHIASGSLTPALIAEKPRWANRPNCAKRAPFSQAEKRKLMELRLFHNLTYAEIATWFPGRSFNTIGTIWNKYIEQQLDKYLSPTEMEEYLPQVIATLRSRKIPVPAAYSKYIADDTAATPSFNDTGSSALRPQGYPRKREQEAAGRVEIDRHPSEVQKLSAETQQAPDARPRRDVSRPRDYYAVPPSHREEPASLSEATEEPHMRTAPRIDAARLKVKRVRSSHGSDPQPNPRPYLAFNERCAVRQGFAEYSWDHEWLSLWRGAPLHVDFAPGEQAEVRQAVRRIIDTAEHAYDDELDHVRVAGEVELQRISWTLQSQERLPTRTRDDVEAFLGDLKDGVTSKHRSKWQLAGRDTNTGLSRGALLRCRELGATPCQRTLRDTMFDQMRPSKFFEKTSGDVGSVAWAPNGTTFASGSMALVDPSSMQYNVPNNLMAGNIDRSDIEELAAHFTKRKRPATGPNSTREMHVTQDSRLFSTVSQVDFSSDGVLMYSAGYDGVVRYWDMTFAKPRLAGSFDHDAPVDLLAVKPAHLHSDPHVIATGCQVSEGSVKVFTCQQDASMPIALSSEHARSRPTANLFPSALRWGEHASVLQCLLAGFATNRTDDQDGRETLGGLSMWDLNHGSHEAVRLWPNPRNVFDVSWSPHSSLFAVACVAGNGRGDRRTKSEVKLYHPKDEFASQFLCRMTLECPASDINDVIFSPYDSSLVSIGCTDGSVYMWDIRRPDHRLHQFSHDKPLQVLHYETRREREKLDTGVRFLSWGHTRNRLCTGSSDGTVALWDPYRGMEDARRRNVAQLDSGVMSGAFNQDYSRLLLGSVNGRIDILEVGSEHTSIRSSTALRRIEADSSHTRIPTEDPDSGISSANALITSNAIAIRDMGAFPVRQAVQGPLYHSTGLVYNGADAPTRRTEAAAFQKELRDQLLSTDRCTAPRCSEYSKGFGITAEASGDSGRSADRIPDALRESGPLEASHKPIPAGMAKCATCGRPARLRLGDDAHEAGGPPQCERCGFSCMRCGKSASYSVQQPDGESVECLSCGCVWQADVLGYKLIVELGPATESATDGRGRAPRWQRRSKKWATGLTKLSNAARYGDGLSKSESEMLREQSAYFDDIYDRFEAVVDKNF